MKLMSAMHAVRTILANMRWPVCRCFTMAACPPSGLLKRTVRVKWTPPLPRHVVASVVISAEYNSARRRALSCLGLGCKAKERRRLPTTDPLLRPRATDIHHSILATLVYPANKYTKNAYSQHPCGLFAFVFASNEAIRYPRDHSSKKLGKDSSRLAGRNPSRRQVRPSRSNLHPRRW